MSLVELNRNDAKHGRLPAVCVYCGEPATCLRRRVFTGRTPITLVIGRGMDSWDRRVAFTWPARLAAAISLVLWTLVVAAGRWVGFTMLAGY